MKKDYILFIDSGIGGLSTLCKCYKKINANFIYFADNLNAPYGNHSQDEIYKFLENIILTLLKKYHISIVVLACNTATTSSINKLRRRFQELYFIGTEPAIMLAYNLNFKRILSVATPTTINQKKYKKLAKSIDATIKNLALPTFASSIEEYFVSKTIYSYFEMQKNIYKIASISRNFDCLVLGCTHYVTLKDKICKIASKPTLDGNDGVSKQVQFYHAKIYRQNNAKQSIKIMLSNNKNNLKQIYKKIFNEILAKN